MHNLKRRIGIGVSSVTAAANLAGCGLGGSQMVQFPGQEMSAPSAAAGGAPYKDGQYTGSDVLNNYGDVQVKVVISGGKVTDVQALSLPYDRQRSAEISQTAEPQLKSEVISAQNALIDVVSGATYTSDGYAQSVQSALDQAHK